MPGLSVTEGCIQAWLDGTTSIKASMVSGEGSEEEHGLWSQDVTESAILS